MKKNKTNKGKKWRCFCLTTFPMIPAQVQLILFVRVVATVGNLSCILWCHHHSKVIIISYSYGGRAVLPFQDTEMCRVERHCCRHRAAASLVHWVTTARSWHTSDIDTRLGQRLCDVMTFGAFILPLTQLLHKVKHKSRVFGDILVVLIHRAEILELRCLTTYFK